MTLLVSLYIIILSASGAAVCLPVRGEFVELPVRIQKVRAVDI